MASSVGMFFFVIFCTVTNKVVSYSKYANAASVQHCRTVLSFYTLLCVWGFRILTLKFVLGVLFFLGGNTDITNMLTGSGGRLYFLMCC